MSRTLRRMGDKTRNKGGRCNFESDWTTEYAMPDGSPLDYSYHGLWISVPMTGQEYWKNYHKYHSKNKSGWGYRKMWREQAENTCKARNKQEIDRFIQNPDYEIILHKPECLSWFD